MITWYVAYTRPNGEAEAVKHLQRQGYTTYLPQYRRAVRHARRHMLVMRPLFPRYLFVGLDPTSQRWRPIRSTCGVVGLVTSGDRPAPVAPEIVEHLKGREREGAFDLVAPVQRLRAGDMVKVKKGPDAELVGRLLSVADKERVVILLDLLGRPVPAEVPLLALEAA
jgi:transcriptional antiterminator RfaH